MLKGNKMSKEFKKIVKKELSYIPEMFIGVKKPLTFKFMPLSQKELARFADAGTRLNVQSSMLILGTTEIEYEIARTAITGWENLIVDNKELAFKRGSDRKLDESLIEDIDGFFDILVEVGKYISVVSKFPEMAKGE
jgi:hypothetical protein